jgi:PAS domain-containing protein
MGQGQAFGWEGRVRVGTELRWIAVLASATLQGDGSVLWDGVSTEITDRKLAELALREIEERNRLLLEYSPVGILHYTLTLQVSYCNQQFARIMGAPLSYMNALDCRKLKDQRVIPACARPSPASSPSTRGHIAPPTRAGSWRSP